MSCHEEQKADVGAHYLDSNPGRPQMELLGTSVHLCHELGMVTVWISGMEHADVISTT